MQRIDLSRHVWAPGAAVVALAFAVSANTLVNGFIWDDPIILDRQLPVFKTLGSILIPPAGIPQFASDYYRPLVVATYLLDNAIGGRNPFWYHLTVLLAHCAAAGGVYALARQLALVGAATAADAGLIGVLAGALFAVHPIHTEAVAWAAGRADVLAAAFSVTAAAAHLAGRRDYRWAIAAGVALWLGLAAKEAAGALLILLPLMDWLAPPSAPARSARSPERSRAARRRAAASPGPAAEAPSLLSRYVPLVLAVALYGGLRLAALGPVRAEQVSAGMPSLSSIFAALAVYFGKLSAPVSLNAYITELPQGLLAPSLAVATELALIALAVWAASRRLPLITVGVAWILLGIIPPLAILVKIPEAPVAERYLYFPSVGFCLILGWVGLQGLRLQRPFARRAVVAVICSALVAGAVASIDRNAVWRTDLSLWSDTVVKSPEAAMPLRSLAGSLLAAGRTDEAVATYEAALEKRNTPNGKLTIYNNLGSIALTRGDIDSAERHFASALEIQPDPDLLFNIGAIHLARARAAEESGDLAGRNSQGEEAAVYLERAETANPHDPEIQAALGQVALYRGDRSGASQRFERALSMGLRGPTADQVRSRLAEWNEADAP